MSTRLGLAPVGGERLLISSILIVLGGLEVEVGAVLALLAAEVLARMVVEANPT